MDERRKTRFGRVVSNKTDKTVVVAIDKLRRHALYKKTIKSTVKYIAHDENNECGPGDKVMITETRTLSKRKRWRVAEIISKGVIAEIQPKEIA